MNYASYTPQIAVHNRRTLPSKHHRGRCSHSSLTKTTDEIIEWRDSSVATPKLIERFRKLEAHQPHGEFTFDWTRRWAAWGVRWHHLQVQSVCFPAPRRRREMSCSPEYLFVDFAHKLCKISALSTSLAAEQLAWYDGGGNRPYPAPAGKVPRASRCGTGLRRHLPASDALEHFSIFLTDCKGAAIHVVVVCIEGKHLQAWDAMLSLLRSLRAGPHLASMQAIVASADAYFSFVTRCINMHP